MYRVAVDELLGVRPTYEGLVVDPVIPRAWKALRVERVFRGTRYIIEIENPDGRERGVRELWCGRKAVQISSRRAAEPRRVRAVV
jgi:cellobiose phosphorylase